MAQHHLPLIVIQLLIGLYPLKPGGIIMLIHKELVMIPQYQVKAAVQPVKQPVCFLRTSCRQIP